jgi:hypothetical protein
VVFLLVMGVMKGAELKLGNRNYRMRSLIE